MKNDQMHSETGKAEPAFVKRSGNKTQAAVGKLSGELAALHAYRIELLGGCELQVDGCRGIVRYDPTVVCFRVAGAVFCVYGQELVIESMRDGGMTIRGRIERTELVR